MQTELPIKYAAQNALQQFGIVFDKIVRTRTISVNVYNSDNLFVFFYFVW